MRRAFGVQIQIFAMSTVQFTMFETSPIGSDHRQTALDSSWCWVKTDLTSSDNVASFNS